MMKTEGGSTHLGAYIGGGRTTNSPENYHDSSWKVKGYPANVQMILLQGVPQGELNKNMLAADTVLNKGVKFPSDYKNDVLKTADLNTTLHFYRDWIKDEPYLKNDPQWATYCAEHKTIYAMPRPGASGQRPLKMLFASDPSKRAAWNASCSALESGAI